MPSRSSTRRFLSACLMLCCTACASLEQQTWYQKARAATVGAVDKTVGATSKAASRMQDYLAREDMLKKFTDAGEHAESAVLDVLRKAGVSRNASTPADPAANKPPADKQTTPKPVKAPPGAPPAATIASELPKNYQGGYRWPLDAGIVSSEYGARWGKTHHGMDIAADVGEPVYATAAGEVIYAGNGMSGYGNVIILRHDASVTSLYAHNSELNVKLGQSVTQGEMIALLGNTGRSTGPHVHFEIRRGEATLDPRALLPKTMIAKKVAPQKAEGMVRTAR